METHRRLCYARASELGYTVIEEYVEPGKSALSKTKQYSSAFIASMRDLMDNTVGDQDHAQRILQKQLKNQLATLDTQEETSSTRSAIPLTQGKDQDSTLCRRART